MKVRLILFLFVLKLLQWIQCILHNVSDGYQSCLVNYTGCAVTTISSMESGGAKIQLDL